MNQSAGIVGLPNVGKSTLFNTITNSQVLAANYPFATIEPNVGVVKVYDERLFALAKLINPKKTTPAICSFTDIAGLVQGASKGEGLGNKFLSNIKDVEVICHVIRCFESKEITHVVNSIDPVRDYEIVNTELILSDIEFMEKKMVKIQSNAKTNNPLAQVELNAAKKIMNMLNSQQPIDLSVFDEKEIVFVKQYNLLTAKPVIYICNIDETDISYPDNNPYYQKFKTFIGNKGICLPLAISMEYEISQLNDEERKVFMSEMNIEKTGLDKLIKLTYDTLGIKTFFTFGTDEVKAWSFTEGMTAPQCAGTIHTDIQKGFIRAEIMTSDDLIKYGSENAVKEHGKLRIEGKDYVMQDGDVAYYRFSK